MTTETDEHSQDKVVVTSASPLTTDTEEERSPTTSEALLAPPAGTRTQYSRSSTRIPQIVAALAASIGAFGLGNVVAWSSPALPSLQEDERFRFLKDDATARTWIGSIVTIGAAASTLVSGPVIDFIGRKWTLCLLGLPFIIGWIMVAFAYVAGDYAFAVMMTGRFITGFCGGAFTLVVPVYTSEIAETEIRGTLASSMVLVLVAGILFVNVVGAKVNWFWLSVICTFVPVIFLASMILMPESPTFLLMTGRHNRAKRSLQWLRRSLPDDVAEELRQIQRGIDESYAQPLTLAEVTKPYVLKPFLICLGLMWLQQVSLINIVVFYAVDIFRSAGSSIDANLCSIIVAFVQFIFAGVSTFLVDRVGRRLLLALSSVGVGVSLAVLGVFYYMKEQNGGVVPEGTGWLPLTSLIVFIVTYNMGLGPLPWCMLSELIGGSRVKSYTSAAAASCCWILAFLVTKYYNDLERALNPSGGHWLFAGLSLMGVAFAVWVVPETKGKSLEEIQRLFK